MFREDWEETKETLYTQKQGKHTRDQKETTILRVKDLKSYIEKMASSKTDLKDLNDGEEIEICLDLDAGGGRVVAEFDIFCRVSFCGCPFLCHQFQQSCTGCT